MGKLSFTNLGVWAIVVNMRLALLSLVFCLASSQTWATSCAWSSKDHMESDGIFALISPLAENKQTRFEDIKVKVWKIYSGEIEETISISNSTFFAYWEIDLSDISGGQPYEKLAMPLYKNDNGIYTNDLCAESFTQAYVEDQIAHGLEFGSRQHYCFANIERAYDAIFLTGKFQLDDEENCAKHVPEYDRHFGKGN